MKGKSRGNPDWKLPARVPGRDRGGNAPQLNRFGRETDAVPRRLGRRRFFFEPGGMGGAGSFFHRWGGRGLPLCPASPFRRLSPATVGMPGLLGIFAAHPGIPTLLNAGRRALPEKKTHFDRNSANKKLTRFQKKNPGPPLKPERGGAAMGGRRKGQFLFGPFWGTGGPLFLFFLFFLERRKKKKKPPSEPSRAREGTQGETDGVRRERP